MLKHPIQKVWAYIGKVFPGIRSEKEPIPAENQWTGEPDFEDGEQLVFPYMRCKLSGEVRNAKGSSVHADHIDGDRLNNHIDNFFFAQLFIEYMISYFMRDVYTTCSFCDTN